MNNHLIWIKAKCTNYARLTSKLQSLRIPIFEMELNKNTLYLKVYAKDFEKIKKYLASYKFKKEHDLGIYALWEKIKKNHIFLFMLLLGALLYLFFTHMIVKINIVHENKEIRELLKEELKERGIHILTLKKSYKTLDKIKQEILDEYPDKLDWLEIETVGMVYNIRVEERIITDTSKEDKTCDLVAKKEGTISSILLSEGEVVVDLNDYVRAGDTLISGKVMYNESEKRSICAKGEVYATVWYTVDVTIPFDYSKSVPTGKKKYNIVWEVDENKKQLFKDRFENFESTYTPILKMFDFTLYLESEHETNKKEEKYTENEALEMALKKAEESIMKKLGDKDKILDKKVLKKTVNNSTIDVEIFVIAEEMISTEKITVAEEKEELSSNDLEHN